MKPSCYLSLLPVCDIRAQWLDKTCKNTECPETNKCRHVPKLIPMVHFGTLCNEKSARTKQVGATWILRDKSYPSPSSSYLVLRRVIRVKLHSCLEPWRKKGDPTWHISSRKFSATLSDTLLFAWCLHRNTLLWFWVFRQKRLCNFMHMFCKMEIKNGLKVEATIRRWRSRCSQSGFYLDASNVLLSTWNKRERRSRKIGLIDHRVPRVNPFKKSSFETDPCSFSVFLPFHKSKIVGEKKTIQLGHCQSDSRVSIRPRWKMRRQFGPEGMTKRRRDRQTTKVGH